MEGGPTQPLSQAFAGLFQLRDEPAGQEAHQRLQRQTDGQHEDEIAEGGIGQQPLAHLQCDKGQHLRGRENMGPTKSSPLRGGSAQPPADAEPEHQRHTEEGNEGNCVDRRRQIVMPGARQQLVTGVIIRCQEQVLGDVANADAGQREGDHDQCLAGSDAALHGESSVPPRVPPSPRRWRNPGALTQLSLGSDRIHVDDLVGEDEGFLTAGSFSDAPQRPDITRLQIGGIRISFQAASPGPVEATGGSHTRTSRRSVTSRSPADPKTSASAARTPSCH